MWKKLQRWMNPPEKLCKEIELLQRCDVEDLPLLVITDADVMIEKLGVLKVPAITHALHIEENLRYYAPALIKMRCNQTVGLIVAGDYRPASAEPEYPTFVEQVPGVVGLQFWHDNGKQYVYWGWLNPKYKNRVDFPSLVFDGLARQGLDRRTVDHFRVDYRGPRLYQHPLL